MGGVPPGTVGDIVGEEITKVNRRRQWEDNWIVKHPSTPKHPGPFRIASVGGEAGAIIVAIGFVYLGLAGLPIAKSFLAGAVLLGAVVAILFRVSRKKPLFPDHFF